MKPRLTTVPSRLWFLNSPRQIAEACQLAAVFEQQPENHRDLVSLGRSESSPHADPLLRLLGDPYVLPQRLVGLDRYLLRGFTRVQTTHVVTGDLDYILFRNGVYDAEALDRMRVTLIDDGLSTISFAKLIEKLGLPNVRIFSRYHPLISPDLLLNGEQPKFTPIQRPMEAGTLGIIGTPACELFGVTEHDYATHLSWVANELDCSRIEYFPHRRERVKFANRPEWRVHPPGVGTLSTLSKGPSVPEVFYSTMSSSLVDVYYSVPSGTKFAFGRVPRYPDSAFRRKSLAAYGIDTIAEIHSTFVALGFVDVGSP